MDQFKESKKEKDDALMHDLTEGQQEPMFTQKLLGLLLVIALLGIGTGYLLAQNLGGSGGTGDRIKAGTQQKGKVFGERYSKKFDNPAEGLLKEGGIEGEGEYRLERGESKSQWVYLTSQTVDLSQFIDRKVKVWGHSQKGLKAGWLLDVTGVEVL